MGVREPSTAPTTYGIWWRSWNSCAYCISIHSGTGRPVDDFLEQIFLMARQIWETTDWLDDRPILYKSAMHCIEFHVASLEIDTTTFTWIRMATCMSVSCVRKSGARVLHKYSKVEMFIRMRPLNSLTLNEPNKVWLKNLGRCNPRSWAHRRRGRLPLYSLNPWSASVMKPNCCHCHN